MTNMITPKITKMSVVSGFYVYALMIVDLLRRINAQWLHFPNSLIDGTRNVIYVLIFLVVVYDMLRRKKWIEPLVLAYVFVTLSFISIIINPSIMAIIDTSAMLFVSRIIPAYYLARYTSNWLPVVLVIEKGRWLALIYATVILLFPEIYSMNYMPLAYNMLIPTSCLVSIAIIKKKSINWVFAAPLAFVMTIHGARGPLICLFLVIIYDFYVVYARKNVTQRIRYIVGISSIALTVYYVMDRLIGALAMAFPSSRTLTLFSLGKLFDSSRNTIYEALLAEWWQKPFTFRGIHGDAAFLSKSSSIDINSGIYAHNFILEILFDFGLVFGFFTFIVWAYFTLKSARLAKKSGDIALIVIFSTFVISTLPRIMISGSYVTDYSIWLMIGMIVNVCKRETEQSIALLAKCQSQAVDDPN